MAKFLPDDDNDDAKAVTIPWVFYENSRAKNGTASRARFGHTILATATLNL